MTKQIPLRVENSEIEELEKIKNHFSEKTVNKAIIEVLKRYLPTHEELMKARKEIIELNIKIGGLRENYELMMYHKEKLEEILK